MNDIVSQPSDLASSEIPVWDCFIINDEFELLKFRLDHLAGVVDTIVVVEAPWTHTGRSKPLHVAGFLGRLEAHRSRIRHIVVQETFDDDTSPSDRVRAQLRGIRSALDDVAPDDLVIVGDLDEIPSRAAISTLRSELRQPMRLIMDHAVLAANLKVPLPFTDGPKACRGSQLSHPEMALSFGDPDAAWSPISRHVMVDAGWHLSFLGGNRTVRDKLGSYLHVELDTPFNRSDTHLDRCLRFAVSLRGHHLLKRLRPHELPPMLAELRRDYPALFDFRTDAPLTTRLLYRAYTRARQSRRFPARVASVGDRSLALALSLAVVLLPWDVLASLATRARHSWRRRGAVFVMRPSDEPSSPHAGLRPRSRADRKRARSATPS